ncbi:thioesterase, partial [Streptococcus danieliae]|nr:thioesterase [Streptococcus danieliae]
RDLLAKNLDTKLTSVGSHISLDHLTASKIGTNIKVEVELRNIEKEKSN